MTTTKIKLKELNLGFSSDVGAPMPVVLATEYKIHLLFYVAKSNPNFDGLSVHVRDVNEDIGLALVTFRNYQSYKFGMPNDEAIRGHPYYAFGLSPYSFFEVENSDWIKQLEQINSAHEHHNKELFNKYKHFIFFFHDSNFECVAESFTTEKLDMTMEKAVWKVACELCIL
ncbi:MAG: hypothetical protein HY564_02675 [Candidatus Jacksonbacteria bacterium]|nr:hypothetical protein [Candidatus Jacksonbacteria bacterium]